MTDDFMLFPGSESGDPAVDADIALIAAYLARELSLVQIVAVEERLATDAAFREKVAPIIEGWFLAGSFASGTTRAGASSSRAPESDTGAPLTRAEIDAGWQRYLTDADADNRPAHATPTQTPTPSPRLARGGSGNDHSTTQRRRSMTRIAAVITMIVLPIVVSAQLVVYAAKHADAPGHKLARAIVPQALRAPSQAEPERIATRAPNGDTIRDGEGPAARTLTLVPQFGVEPGQSSSAAAGIAPELPATQAQRAKPDRARIAALAAQYTPAVVRGDTTADYVIMVLDATDKYVWSTHGIGSVWIEVGADSRTSAERSEYLREHRAEYMGSAAATGAERGGRGAGASASAGGSDSSAVRMRAIISSLDYAAARTQALIGSSSTTTPLYIVDGVRMTNPNFTANDIAAKDIQSIEVIKGAAAQALYGSRATNGVISIQTNAGQSADSYMLGFGSVRGGQIAAMNQASGLQEAGRGQSGIQGLRSTSVSLAETYTFPAGELGPRSLKIMVVHLAAGSAWKGR